MQLKLDTCDISPCCDCGDAEVFEQGHIAFNLNLRLFTTTTKSPCNFS